MSHRICRLEPRHQKPVLAFARALPPHDLLFLGRDLGHPRVVDAWTDAVRDGWIDGLVAEDADTDAVVGTAALVRDPLGWSAHVGEIRLLVSSERRGAGLGRDLLEAVMAVAAGHGLVKLTARMTSDQAGAVALFEGLGFRAEAMLRDHVRGRDGTSHDLAILSLDLEGAAARHRAFGTG